MSTNAPGTQGALLELGECVRCDNGSGFWGALASVPRRGSLALVSDRVEVISKAALEERPI